MSYIEMNKWINGNIGNFKVNVKDEEEDWTEEVDIFALFYINWVKMLE